MDELMDEIRAAVRGGAWRLALAGTMTLPDICAVIESDEQRVGKRYRAWWDANIKNSWVTADVAWKMRNGVLHAGSASTGKFSRVVFVRHPMATIHNSVADDALVLDMPQFTEEVFTAVAEWNNKFEGTLRYQQKASELMRWHPHGLRPYVSGLPLLA